MAGSAANDEALAKALVGVLGDSRWIAIRLAKAFLSVRSGLELKQVVRDAYVKGSISQRQLSALLVQAEAQGFKTILEARTKTGSAENPIVYLGKTTTAGTQMGLRASGTLWTLGTLALRRSITNQTRVNHPRAKSLEPS